MTTPLHTQESGPQAASNTQKNTQSHEQKKRAVAAEFDPRAWQAAPRPARRPSLLELLQSQAAQLQHAAVPEATDPPELKGV